MLVQPHGLSRRQFLGTSAAGIGAVTLSWRGRAASAAAAAQKPVRFGVVSDVHKDVMHDADERLTVFVKEMQKERPDFVIQMGDFYVSIPVIEALRD
ncbi:MAG: twin-arginine translocation signal domain-containing protein [Planctomycetota bacterium]|nr:twin-arginine translocation signal domain-containing protein [Planctomycetota bacterium]